MRNAATLTQARPSKLSSSSATGTRARTEFRSNGQCANNKSHQVCSITHGPGGSGHGRCAVWLRIASRSTASLKLVAPAEPDAAIAEIVELESALAVHVRVFPALTCFLP